jgi:hypothetical protein
MSFPKYNPAILEQNRYISGYPPVRLPFEGFMEHEAVYPSPPKHKRNYEIFSKLENYSKRIA